MKLKGLFLVIDFVIFFFLTGYSQSSPGLQMLIPASPNAAALGKYGEIPVGEYTGIPNITVPVYTLKSRELEVPIALNYHAGGIRVEEVASWVGAGWSLNAGGVITRSIRGMPDDILGGYFYSHAGATTIAKEYFYQRSAGTSVQLGNGNVSNADLITLDLYRNSLQDAAPDIFSFNFGKYSGQFFMNEEGQIVVSPLSALKVEYTVGSLNSNGIQQWVLTTPDGVKYVFGSSSDGLRIGLEHNSTNTPWPVTTTGWYLVEIDSPNGDAIALNYTTVNYSYFSRSGQVLNAIIGEQENGAPSALPAKEDNIVLNHMEAPRLTSIDCSTGTLFFDPGSDRTDLPGEKPLSGIDIYGAADKVNPIKKWIFSYDYSINRLTLKTLAEFSAGGQASGQAYQFSYNGPLPNPDPSHTDLNSQDLWGYYNGVPNTVFPQGISVLSPQFGTITVVGADRHSDENSMKAGSLSKIVYPTGGYTTFDYEANKLYTSADNTSIPQQGVGYSVGFAFGENESKSQTFTITYPNPATGKVDFSGSVVAMNKTCPFDNAGFNQCYYAQIKGVNGTQFGPFDLKEGSFDYQLLPGTYEMTGQGAGLSAQSDNIIHYFGNYTEYPPPPNGSPMTPINLTVGGLRIQRITNYNYDGSVASVDKYLYNKFSDNTVSSAVMVNMPSAYANVFRMYKLTCNEGGLAVLGGFRDYLQVKSFPLIPLMPTQSAPLGYQNVTKLSGENGENGKEEYTFTTANDFPDEYHDFRPYSPPCNFDWRRGLLLKQTIYKNKSGVFVPVEDISNNYSNAIKQTIAYGFNVDVDMTADNTTCKLGVAITGGDYYVGSYRTISEQQYLQSETIRTYDQDNPSLYNQVTNVYTYDTTLGHYQLLSKKFTNSKNQLVEYDYQHPQDAPLTGYMETARQQMISKFMLTPVLDEKIIRNGALVRDTKKNYKVFGNNLALPESIEVQIGNNASEKRVEFLQYDGYGNLLQQHKVNDVLNTYIWNYNKSYPIASVLNADAGNIAYTSFEGDGAGNWTIPDNIRNGTSSFTGAQSYDLSSGKTITATVTTGSPYVVSYWSRNGAVTVMANGVPAGVSITGETKKGWTYYQHLLPSTTTSVSVSSSGATIDELRLYPSAAQMTTYTYNPLVGMTSGCDINNKPAYYEYDAWGRLMDVKDQDGNVIKTVDYHYKAQ
ncbi:MAG TPA: hypothetical protein VGN00_29780 [Puia sp.]|jgi:hypothetical protein